VAAKQDDYKVILFFRVSADLGDAKGWSKIWFVEVSGVRCQELFRLHLVHLKLRLVTGYRLGSAVANADT